MQLEVFLQRIYNISKYVFFSAGPHVLNKRENLKTEKSDFLLLTKISIYI